MLLVKRWKPLDLRAAESFQINYSNICVAASVSIGRSMQSAACPAISFNKVIFKGRRRFVFVNLCLIDACLHL